MFFCFQNVKIITYIGTSTTVSVPICQLAATGTDCTWTDANAIISIANSGVSCSSTAACSFTGTLTWEAYWNSWSSSFMFYLFSFTNKSSPAFELKTKSPYGLILKSHVLRLVWRLLKKYCRLTIIPVAGKFDGFSDQFRTWHNPHGCCNSWTRNICGEVGDHQSHQIESKSCRLGAFGIVVCKTQCLRHQSRTRPQCCSIQCHKCSFQRYNYQWEDNPDLEN